MKRALVMGTMALLWVAAGTGCSSTHAPTPPGGPWSSWASPAVPEAPGTASYDGTVLAQRWRELLALRSEVAAIRDYLMGRPPPASDRWTPAAPHRPADTGAVYPSGPVRVEETEPTSPHSLQDLEQRAVERALADAGGNRRLAAEMLGISERTLYRRIKQFALENE